MHSESRKASAGINRSGSDDGYYYAGSPFLHSPSRSPSIPISHLIAPQDSSTFSPPPSSKASSASPALSVISSLSCSGATSSSTLNSVGAAQHFVLGPGGSGWNPVNPAPKTNISLSPPRSFSIASLLNNDTQHSHHQRHHNSQLHHQYPTKSFVGHNLTVYEKENHLLHTRETTPHVSFEPSSSDSGDEMVPPKKVISQGVGHTQRRRTAGSDFDFNAPSAGPRSRGEFNSTSSSFNVPQRAGEPSQLQTRKTWDGMSGNRDPYRRQTDSPLRAPQIGTGPWNPIGSPAVNRVLLPNIGHVDPEVKSRVRANVEAVMMNKERSSSVSGDEATRSQHNSNSADIRTGDIRSEKASPAPPKRTQLPTKAKSLTPPLDANDAPKRTALPTGSPETFRTKSAEPASRQGSPLKPTESSKTAPSARKPLPTMVGHKTKRTPTMKMGSGIGTKRTLSPSPLSEEQTIPGGPGAKKVKVTENSNLDSRPNSSQSDSRPTSRSDSRAPSEAGSFNRSFTPVNRGAFLAPASPKPSVLAKPAGMLAKPAMTSTNLAIGSSKPRVESPRARIESPRPTVESPKPTIETSDSDGDVAMPTSDPIAPTAVMDVEMSGNDSPTRQVSRETSTKVKDTTQHDKEKAEEQDRVKAAVEAEKKRVEAAELEKKQRLEREQLEKERLARIEEERLEKERSEKERLEKERKERERVEKDRLEKERLEKERAAAEEARIAREQATARERIEKEKAAALERLEKERLLEEKAAEEARMKAVEEARQKAVREKQARDREALEKEALAKAAREKAEREAHEKAEREAHEARERAAREAREKVEREAREAREREAREEEARLAREAREAREKEEREKAVEEAEEKAAKEAQLKAEREAQLKAAQEEAGKAKKAQAEAEKAAADARAEQEKQQQVESTENSAEKEQIQPQNEPPVPKKTKIILKSSNSSGSASATTPRKFVILGHEKSAHDPHDFVLEIKYDDDNESVMESEQLVFLRNPQQVHDYWEHVPGGREEACDGFWKMYRIFAERQRGGKTQYEVAWIGSVDRGWEPRAAVQAAATDLIAVWERQKAEKRRERREGKQRISDVEASSEDDDDDDVRSRPAKKKRQSGGGKGATSKSQRAQAATAKRVSKPSRKSKEASL